MNRFTLIQGTLIAFSLVALFTFGSVSCSRAPMQPMSGTGSTSDGSSTSNWSGGDPTTNMDPGAINDGSNAANNTCSGTNCAWAANDANKVLGDIKQTNPVNPGSDLGNSISDLLKKAAQDGPSSVEQSCDTSQTATQNQQQGCFNRMALGAQILSQCLSGLDQFSPRPGEPLLGTYQTKCPPIEGWTDGNIIAQVTGDYPSYGTHFNFPRAMQMDGVSPSGTSLKFEKKAGAGTVSVTYNDGDNAQAGQLYIYNKAAPPNPYVCKKTMNMTKSANPIPDKVSQGMKSASDCYRKALFLMSPLFDTMFKGMPDDQASTLLMSAMNMTF